MTTIVDAVNASTDKDSPNQRNIFGENYIEVDEDEFRKVSPRPNEEDHVNLGR